jgi:hypothetical protein
MVLDMIMKGVTKKHEAKSLAEAEALDQRNILNAIQAMPGYKEVLDPANNQINGARRILTGKNNAGKLSATLTPLSQIPGIPGKTTPKPLPGALRVGNAAMSGLGRVAQFAVPMAIQAAGGLARTAGATAGGVAQAIGNAPKYLDNTSANQEAVYGPGLFKALGGVTGDLGAAANVGLKGVGEAVGSATDEVAKAIRLQTVLKQLQQYPDVLGSRAMLASSMINSGNRLGGVAH